MKKFLVDVFIVTPLAVATVVWLFWATGHLVMRCNEVACLAILLK